MTTRQPAWGHARLFVVFLLLPTAMSAQQSDQSAAPLGLSPATSDIRIDGDLDEPAWRDAASLALAYEYFPGDNAPAPVETECLITFTESRLYIAFRAYDSNPEHIRAHLMDRDDIQPFVQDDHVGILLDTFNDERRAFQLRVNPLGVQADAIFSELEGYEDFSWDIIWDSAARITEDGYVVELAIPFNQLRFERTEGAKTWGFQAFRSWPREMRHRISSNPHNRDRSCIVCQIRKVRGFEGISPGRNLEASPTVTTVRSDNRTDFPSGDMENGKIDLEPGISMRWGITPNVVLNAAVNPDFSQVEADAAQLDVNNRFALFFEEKRPFFLEGADFFLTPLQAVFTRTVADPLFGAKLTGKAGAHALGAFVTRDRTNTLVIPSNEGSTPASVDQDVNGAVLRYRRDIAAGSTVGALYTGRVGEGYGNHTGGLDAFLRLSPTNTVQLQGLWSQTEYPSEIVTGFGQKEGAFSGGAARVRFDHRSRNWMASVAAEDLGKDFRGDFGFIRRADYRSGMTSVHRIFRGTADKWYSQMTIGVSAERIGDHDGNLTDQTLALESAYAGPLQSQANLILMAAKERYGENVYDLNRLLAFAGMQPGGAVALNFMGRFGDQIDYSNQRLGSETLLAPSLTLKVGRSLNVQATNTTQILKVPEGRLFTANIAQATVRYNFSVRTFVRLILQYRTVDRNLPLYSENLASPLDSREEALFSQFLFSYKINAQTVLFLGYSDNHLGSPSYDLTRRDRTLFFKVGYAITA